MKERRVEERRIMWSGGERRVEERDWTGRESIEKSCQ